MVINDRPRFRQAGFKISRFLRRKLRESLGTKDASALHPRYSTSNEDFNQRHINKSKDKDTPPNSALYSALYPAL
jgi:hypothetical protein